MISAATEFDGVAPVGDQVLRELGHQRTQHLTAADDDGRGDRLSQPDARDGRVGGPSRAPQARRRHGADPRRPGAKWRTQPVLGARHAARGHGDGGCAGTGAGARTHADAAVAARRARRRGRRRRADPHLRAVPATTPNCCGSTTPRSRGIRSRAVGRRPTSTSGAAEPWFDPAGLFMAVDSETGRLLGFHWTKVHGAPADGSGRGVRRRASTPAAQGRGLGRLLTVVGMQGLAERLADAAAPQTPW